MLTCQKVEIILVRYVVGALPPWSRVAVVKHLDKCPPCRALLESHYRVAMLVETLPGQEPPVGLWNAIANEIASESPGHERVAGAPRDWRPSLAVATAGLTAGVLLGQFFSTHSSAPPKETAQMSSPRIATFVQQHSSLASTNPLADQVSLAAYTTTAFRDNERMEGEADREAVLPR
jgi:anti-sigma factor RsiW